MSSINANQGPSALPPRKPGTTGPESADEQPKEIGAEAAAIGKLQGDSNQIDASKTRLPQHEKDLLAEFFKGQVHKPAGHPPRHFQAEPLYGAVRPDPIGFPVEPGPIGKPFPIEPLYGAVRPDPIGFPVDPGPIGKPFPIEPLYGAVRPHPIDPIPFPIEPLYGAVRPHPIDPRPFPIEPMYGAVHIDPGSIFSDPKPITAEPLYGAVRPNLQLD